MNLDEWLSRLAAELQLNDVTFDNDTLHTLLDVARDSAHEVTRVAAPLTTYLLGVAVGRGAPLSAVAATTTALALGQDRAEEDQSGQDAAAPSEPTSAGGPVDAGEPGPTGTVPASGESSSEPGAAAANLPD